MFNVNSFGFLELLTGQKPRQVYAECNCACAKLFWSLRDIPFLIDLSDIFFHKALSIVLICAYLNYIKTMIFWSIFFLEY